MKRKKELHSIVIVSAAFVLFLILISSTASATTVTSKVVGTHYNCSSWSEEQYPLINVFGVNYVPLTTKNDPLWKCHFDKLAKLVLDSKSYTLKPGGKTNLGAGYSIQVKQVDVDGAKVWLEFDYNGQYVDDQIVSIGNTWTCLLDNIQGLNNVPVLKVHVKQISQSATDSTVLIDGIWLIDYANIKTLKIGDTIGQFTLTDILYGVGDFNLGSLNFKPFFLETRITNHGTAANPKIYGNKIVYQDKRSGYWNIYMYDISAKKEAQLTNSKSIFTHYFNPDIYLNSVVWECHYLSVKSGNSIMKSDIYMYDFTTKNQIKISTSGNANDPKIYENRIFWVENSISGGYNSYISYIFMYDLSTKKTTKFTDFDNANSFAIYGDRIVFSNNLYYGPQYIYLYNISTKKLTTITDSKPTEWVSYPDIFKNKVVYWVRDDHQICMYDLSTMEESQISEELSATGPSAIYDNKIVWEDDHNEYDKTDIHMYDLLTKTETQITNSEKAKFPAIYDKKIVWVDNRNGNPDIYLGTFI